MKTTPISPFLAVAAATIGALAAEPALTIYNQNFAVVRDRVSLDLKEGVNAVSYADATLHLEADSVVLRDPSGKVSLRILEQSYRADTLSQGLLLSLHEGKEIDFLQTTPEGKETIARGKIVRSGYTPNTGSSQRYGHQFYQRQMQAGNIDGGGSPIIEVEGKLRFSLPGQPLFPALGDDSILKPTLTWQLASDQAAQLDAELSYLTGGFSWQAAYNLLTPEKGDTLDLVGWVTIDNQSGKTFENASLKLMAGDVSKLEPELARAAKANVDYFSGPAEAQVTEKSFDEFHLYTLPRATTLRDRETKQVEFIRATGVKAKTLYVYDGALQNQPYRGSGIQNDPGYGTASNPKVWVMREIENTKENGLGLPLPMGRTRFYRQDDADGRPEFVGENTIDHTPQGETLRIYTGDAFDIVGERKQTDFKINNNRDEAFESFEIKLRNRKKEPVEVRVTETLYRWINWEIVEKSDDFTKTDSQTIEFRVTLQPDEEKTLTYQVCYDWK